MDLEKLWIRDWIRGSRSWPWPDHSRKWNGRVEYHGDRRTWVDGSGREDGRVIEKYRTGRCTDVVHIIPNKNLVDGLGCFRS